jgi:hypothetical protein
MAAQLAAPQKGLSSVSNNNNNNNNNNNGMEWIGFIWLRIGTSGGPL